LFFHFSLQKWMAVSRKVSAFARLVTDVDYARSRRSGSPHYGIGRAAPQAPDDYLRVAPVFRCAPRPTASEAVAWRWRAAHGRVRAKKARNGPSFQRAWLIRTQKFQSFQNRKPTSVV